MEGHLEPHRRRPVPEDRNHGAGGPIREEVEVPAGMLTTDALNLYLHNLPATGESVLKLELFNLTLGRPLPVRVTFHGADDGEPTIFSLFLGDG